MSLSQPNPRPRSIAELASALAAPDQGFVIVDVGARSDVEPMWRPIAPLARFIAFEPDEAECARLNQRGDRAKTFYPYAIGKSSERRTFYVTEFPWSSGLYRASEAFLLGRFPFSTTRPVKEMPVETIALDHFAGRHGLGHVDFIKVDVEGAELEVLQGAAQTLRDRNVLGVKTELWWDPALRGQSAFSEIDAFMHSHGFRLYDIDVTRYPRNPLPVGRLRGFGIGPLAVVTGSRSGGQVLTGDALYFRDPVGARQEGGHGHWDSGSLLRLTGLLDVFGYPECAIELVQEFRAELEHTVDVDRLTDALVPRLGLCAVPFRRYKAFSDRLRLAQNAASYGTSSWRPREEDSKDNGPKGPVIIDLLSTYRWARRTARRLLTAWRGPR